MEDKNEHSRDQSGSASVGAYMLRHLSRGRWVPYDRSRCRLRLLECIITSLRRRCASQCRTDWRDTQAAQKSHSRAPTRRSQAAECIETRRMCVQTRSFSFNRCRLPNGMGDRCIAAAALVSTIYATAMPASEHSASAPDFGLPRTS